MKSPDTKSVDSSHFIVTHLFMSKTKTINVRFESLVLASSYSYCGLTALISPSVSTAAAAA